MRLHSLFLVVVVIATTGTLAKSLLLFLDFLPLLAVDGISAADMLIGTSLNHACQSPEQSEHRRGGLPVDMILHLFQQSGSMFIGMAGGCVLPLHAHFQVLRHAQSKTLDFAKLVLGIGIALLRC